MNTRTDHRVVGNPASARRSFAPARIRVQSGALSRAELVVYVTLLLMLFAAGFVARVAAQDTHAIRLSAVPHPINGSALLQERINGPLNPFFSTASFSKR